MEVKSKICTKCKIEKDLNNFSPKIRSKYGVSSLCKVCTNIWRRNHFALHPELIRQYNLRGFHNISPEEYGALLKKQDGKCAICFKESENKILHIDHDHNTGRIRGLLCNNCNLGLGQFNDDPIRIQKAIEYLKGGIK